MAAQIIRDSYTQTSPFTATDPSVREDLSNVIYDISPTDTPFVSAVGKGSCKSTYHEWQTDALGAVNTSNALIEGADAPAASMVDTTRLGNYTQISGKTLRVSGTKEVVDSAGYNSAFAFERAKKGLELRNDIEAIMLQAKQAKSAGIGVGGADAARNVGTVQAWLVTNNSIGATGTAATGDGSDVYGDNGTPRAFTEALLETVVDNCYISGGNPNVLMVSPANKRITNDFTGRANAVSGVPQVTTVSDSKKISNSVDVYDSDYGMFTIVPNRYMPDEDVFLLETDMWSIDYLRDFKTIPLAVTGDAMQEEMIVEYTLTSKNEKASAAIYDLST